MYFGSKRKSAARRLKLRDRIISMLLAVSLLCGNPIVLPTGAAELVAYCEIEEHSHSEECYTTERVLTCGVTQDNHVHSEACKQTEKTLTCTIVEQVHEHTDACYTTTTNLTCTEHVHTADCAQLTCTDEGHAHTDACYAYTCESPNSTHQHTDSCYTTESVLKCDYHQHTDECYTTTEVNTCGVTQDNHTHSYACYGGEKTLSCTQEEHTHTSACYSNPEADLETADDWKDTLPKEDDFTGTWAKDLLAVAESQLGYKESDKNYQVAEDGETPMGYNRYGAWYSSYTQDENQPYAPWNVIFLFFSIYYSGISDFPLEETCADWVESLDYYDLYREVGKTYPVSEEDTEGEAYTPNPGDMIFLDTDGDGEADRAGIVSEVTEDELTAIEGDVDGAVAEVTYDLSDTEAAVAAEAGEDPQPQILGYADMAQAQADAQPENSIVSDLATLTWSHSSYLYLDLGDITWTNDGAHIVLAYYDGDNDWSFAEMTYYSGTLYRIELPDDMVLTDSKFEFVRMDSSGTFSWSNKWNRTGAEDVYHTQHLKKATASRSFSLPLQWVTMLASRSLSNTLPPSLHLQLMLPPLPTLLS